MKNSKFRAPLQRLRIQHAHKPTAERKREPSTRLAFSVYSPSHGRWTEESPVVSAAEHPGLNVPFYASNSWATWQTLSVSPKVPLMARIVQTFIKTAASCRFFALRGPPWVDDGRRPRCSFSAGVYRHSLLSVRPLAQLFREGKLAGPDGPDVSLAVIRLQAFSFSGNRAR